MQAQIKHTVGPEIVCTFTVQVEHYKAESWNEYLTFNANAKTLKASNGEEVLEVWDTYVVLHTPHQYTFNIVRIREKPAPDLAALKTDWRYRRLDELKNWLITGKAVFQFGAFAGFGHVHVLIDSYARTITIYALNEDEVTI